MLSQQNPLVYSLREVSRNLDKHFAIIFTPTISSCYCCNTQCVQAARYKIYRYLYILHLLLDQNLDKYMYTCLTIGHTDTNQVYIVYLHVLRNMPTGN